MDSLVSVNFQVRTTTPGGDFSPKNIGAIWVEDEQGQFVRTIKLWANRRIEYLYTWNSRTGGNSTDAITGATLLSHETHQVGWNLKDKDGQGVTYGNYQLKVELTDQHAQGPVATQAFTLGSGLDTLWIPDAGIFQDMYLSFEYFPTSIGEPDNVSVNRSYILLQNYPNPFNPSTTIEFFLPNADNINLDIFNLNGELVRSLASAQFMAGQHSQKWDGTNEYQQQVSSGSYIYRLKTLNSVVSNKMLYLK